MTVRKVLRAGHPLVRQESRPVTPADLDDDHPDLVDDMLETMRDHDGVGLAAPQVQSGLRVLVYEIVANERYPDLDESVGPAVLIDPTIVKRSPDLLVDWEGCLSLPELRGRVPRHKWIEVQYHDEDGNQRTRRVEGFEARVIQHEIDHLNGTLFVDRLTSSETLMFRDEYRRYHA